MGPAHLGPQRTTGTGESGEPTATAGSQPEVDPRIARGAATNFLGTLAKLLHPVFLALANRLYGPAEFGLYAIATTIVEIAAGLVNAGWRDAVLLLGALTPGEDPRAHQDAIYERLGHAVQAVVLGSAALTAVFLVVGAPLIARFFPQAGVYGLVMVMLPVLWCLGLAEIGIAATKLLMIMRYDALILGLLKPAAMVVTAVIVFTVRPDATGLAIAFAVAHVTLPIATWWVVRRHFSVGRILAAAVRARPNAKLWGFALPQSANMAFVYFTTGVDVILLGMFDVATEKIAYYKVATSVLRNVRQVKLSFAGAFNPVAARLWVERRLDGLAGQITTVSRWSATIGHGVLLLVVAFHGTILGLFEPSFAGHADFVLVLAVLPALSNALGLAGNAIVMAGLSRWNLLNTVINVGVTTVAGYLLIPIAGLMGAALATTASGVVGTLLQLVQLRWILGVRLSFGQIAAPNVALLAAAAAGAIVWVASDGWPLGLVESTMGVCTLAVYVAVLRLWGLPPEDARVLRPWRRDAPGPTSD